MPLSWRRSLLLLGIATSLLAVFVVAAVSGISRSLLEVTGQTLLQRVTPTALLARVFVFKEGLTMAACGLGAVIVPLVILIAGVRGALFVTGAIVPAIVLLRLPPLRRVDAAVAVPVVAIALLRSLQVFRALPVPRRSKASRSRQETTRTGRCRDLSAGLAGDRYYAIADGTVEVIKDGRLGARRSAVARIRRDRAASQRDANRDRPRRSRPRL